MTTLKLVDKSFFTLKPTEHDTKLIISTILSVVGLVSFVKFVIFVFIYTYPMICVFNIWDRSYSFSECYKSDMPPYSDFAQVIVIFPALVGISLDILISIFFAESVIKSVPKRKGVLMSSFGLLLVLVFDVLIYLFLHLPKTCC